MNEQGEEHMTQDEIIEAAIQGHASTRDAIRWAMKKERAVFAKLVAAKEREFVGLTDKEKSELWEISRAAIPRFHTYATLVEAKLKDKQMINGHDEHEHEEHEEDEWTCDSCGGPMYKQAHWDYGQCDDCGARQELINDDYS